MTQHNPSVRSPWLGGLMTALIVIIVLGFIDSIWASFADGGARPREVGVAQVVRFPALFVGIDLFRLLPDAWSHYYELSSFRKILAVLPQVVLAGLTAAALLAVVLLPMSWFFSRSEGPERLRAAMLERWKVYFWFLTSAAVVSQLSRRLEPWWPAFDTRAVGIAVGATFVLVFFWLLRASWPVLSRTYPAWQAVAALLVVLAAGETVFGPWAHQKPDPLPGRPNIFLISIDSLRADHLESYGYFRETSPNITKLAAEGVRFEKVITPTSWTLPTHTTMLTSMPPNQHGVIIDETALAPSATNIAEIFSSAGYQTAAWVSGPYMRAEYGHYQGFDLYNDYGALKVLAGDLVGEISSPMLTVEVTDYLEEWDRSGRRRPFFIFLHMFDVHLDYIPPAPYDTMFDPDYEGSVDGTEIWWSMQLQPDLAPRDLEHIKALYDGEIRYTDEHIGQLMTLLKDLGTFDDTVIAVTADHGEEFREHGDMAHRRSLYEEVLNVPLVMRFPAGLPRGVTVQRPVRTMDIGSTLLSLAGVEADSGAWVSNRGQLYEPLDLTRLLRGDAADIPEFVSYGDLHGALLSVRSETHKLVTDGASGRFELYDLVNDPGETVNLIEDSQLAGLLLEQLAVWRQQTRGSAARGMRADSHHVEMLRSLGYLR